MKPCLILLISFELVQSVQFRVHPNPNFRLRGRSSSSISSNGLNPDISSAGIIDTFRRSGVNLSTDDCTGAFKLYDTVQNLFLGIGKV